MTTAIHAIRLACLLLGHCVFLQSASAQTPTSEFTTTALAKVKVLEDSSREKNREIDHFKHLCPGLGGYQVIHEEFDARSWLNLNFGEKQTDLRAATFAACPGNFPCKANDVVQWRGIRQYGKFVPYALIYRMCSQSEDTKSSYETLIVIKLDKEKSRVVGKSTGAKANEEAERIADERCR